MSGGRQEGGCRCGTVRFAAEGAPLLTMACHCKGCQRMTGGAYSLSSLYPAAAFTMIAGETVLGGLKGPTRHHFCPECMSWLFTVPEGLDEVVNVRSSMFDDPDAHRPYADMHRREALHGAESGAPCKYDSVPEDSEFPRLMADYSEWRSASAAAGT